MSWSVAAIGRPAAVAAKLAAEFAKNPCVDPEEGLRQAAAVVVAMAIAAQDPKSAVKVSASGHQIQNHGPSGEKTTINNALEISITPIYGFLE